MNTLYGFKIGQTSEFDSDGMRVPVTLVSIKPSVITGLKTMEKNNYWAMQIGLGTKKKNKKVTSRFTREIKAEESEMKKVGEEIQISDVFNSGDLIKVTGTSIGKGFQGVVRRHGFKGGPMTHGATSTKQRHGGSIGQTTTPGRVYKGKKMAGHMGVETVTVKNLQVFAVKQEENLLLVRGLVPGAKGGLLTITKLTK